jgi:RNA polymerase sigma-70 factor (ECF subfamily)
MHDTASLYRDYGRKVSRWAARLTRSASDADDIVQEVFMTVHCRGEALDQVHSPGPWLLKMTLNVVRHLWRSRSRTSKREILWMSESPPNAPASPADELEMRRAAQRLEKAVAALPENYRMVYFLCEVEGLPSPEIAALTGLTPDTLRVRRFRARQQVAKLLSFEPS